MTVSTLDALHRTVLHTVPVGRGLIALAGDERSGHVFVVSLNTPPLGISDTPGSVSMLDAQSGELLGTVTVGQAPGAVAIDERRERVYVVNGGDDTLSILDARTGHLLRTVPAGPASQDVAVDDVSGHVFVGATGDQSVRVLDGTTGRLLRVVHLPLPPSTLLIDEQHSRLVAGSTTNPARLGLLDTRTGAVALVVSRTAEVPLAVDSQRALVITLCMGPGSPALLLRDDRTGRLERTIPWPPSADVFLLSHPSTALDERRGLVYIATWAGPVQVLDERRGHLDSPLAAGDEQQALALDAETGRLFVTNQHDNRMPGAAGWLSGMAHAAVPWLVPPPPTPNPFRHGTLTVVSIR